MRREVAVNVLPDRQRARAAVEALEQAGFRRDDIRVLAEDGAGRIGDVRAEHLNEQGSGIAGAVAGVGSVLVPGVGPDVGVSTFPVSIETIAGPAGGEITGALVGMGVQVDAAARYEEEARRGGLILVVKAGARCDVVQEVTRRFGGYDVETGGRDVAGHADSGSHA